MSDNDEKQTGFLDSLFSLVEDGKSLASEVVVQVGAPKPAPAYESEPHDPAIIHALRSLVMDCHHQGGVLLDDDGGQFRVIIGKGAGMRVYSGPSMTKAILLACEREGTRLGP